MAKTVIEGRVVGPEAIVSLVMLGTENGRSATVDVVIDTGCTAPLVVPSMVAEELGLPLLMTERAELADGSRVDCPVYDGRVMWGGAPRRVRIIDAGPYSLLGMVLLEGHRLTIDVVNGGRVSIEPLESYQAVAT